MNTTLSSFLMTFRICLIIIHHVKQMFCISEEDTSRYFRQDRGEKKFFLIFKIDVHCIQKILKVSESGCVST